MRNKNLPEYYSISSVMYWINCVTGDDGVESSRRRSAPRRGAAYFIRRCMEAHQCIEGHERVVAHLGMWLSFHDAEVL